MLEKCRNDNVLMFPKKEKNMKLGSIFLSAQDNGDVRIEAEGLSPREIRSVLCVAINASYKFE